MSGLFAIGDAKAGEGAKAGVRPAVAAIAAATPQAMTDFDVAMAHLRDERSWQDAVCVS
jgi:hypothetical protein